MAGSKINKSAIVEGARSIKYTAQELTIDRMPFTTNTVKNSLEMAKDLREWTRRNNPFKPVNGNKDPLVRQIANASMKGLRAVKQDLLHGDLRFSRLNKEFRAFVGGEDPEHMFDFVDMDFGDFDYGGGDEGDGNEDRTMVAMGQSISREFTDTQMAATSATISAVETATDRISTVSLRASEVATNRIISTNLANMSRLSTQVGQVHGEIATVNQNLSLLVQQGNDLNQFLGQSQKFMENTEQSLNDIKSLLEVIAAPQQQGQNKRRSDNEPEWIQNGFDIKGYLKDKMSNTMTGMGVSAAVSKIFTALHLEVPSFIDQSIPADLSDLKPLNTTLSKLLPAINRFAHVDKMIEGAFKTVLAKIDEGEYVKGGTVIGDLLYSAGLDGWGYNPNGRRKLFDSSHYNKGTIAWNGKSERALQEVIPSYLSNIEGYLKNIAEGLDADRAERRGTTSGIRTDQFRLYDYENGAFTTLEGLRKRVQQEYNEAAESAFSGIMSKLQGDVHTGDGFNREINAVFNEMMKDETRVSSKENAAEFKRVLRKYRKDGKLNDASIMSLFDALTREIKPNAVNNLSEFRQNTNERANPFYHLGEEELWNLKANIQFKTTADFEQQERDKIAQRYANDAVMRENELRKYDERLEKAKKAKEERESTWLSRKLKSTEAGKALYDLWDDLKKHGGPLNRTIEYAQDYGIVNPLLSLVHGIKGYSKGTGIEGLDGDQVIAGHNKEIILTRQQSDMIRMFSKKNAETLSKISTARIRRRTPANDIERKFSNNVHNAEVEKALSPEEETRERIREMSDNIATMTAMELNSAEADKKSGEKDTRSKMFTSLFGEKDGNGFFQGKMFSGLGNMFVDFKNIVNHAINGDAYITSAGVKVAKTDDSLKGNLGKSLASVGDAAARTIFGEGYKDSKFYKGISESAQDFMAGLKATYNGEEVNDEFWANLRLDRASKTLDKKVQSELSPYMRLSPRDRRRYEQMLVFKHKDLSEVKGYLEEAYAEDSSIENDDPEWNAQLGRRSNQISNINSELSRISKKLEWIDKFNEVNKSGDDSEADKQTNLALFGVEDPEDFNKQMSKATQETIEAGNNAHDKMLRGVKFGLAGAIGVPMAKLLGLGAIPSLFLPGGPIGGAILGVGVSILSKNKTVMAHLFGGEDKDGNKIDGIISQDLQEKFKTASKKILGPATIGAVGGLIFPKAVGTVSHALGPVLGGLIGTGPIGGAILASGAALMLGSTKIKDALFGRDEEGKATGLISKGIAKGKKFISDNKDALKRLGLGTLGGALLGSSMFGLTGLALGPTLLGSAIGISSASTKFTDYLFGTKMMTKDKDGNTVWTRDGDGLIGRIGRMISLKLLTPVKRFVSNGADRFIEYIRHDIGFSIRSMFAPFTVPIKDATDNLAKSFKKIGDKATELAKKFFDPLLKISGGLLSGLTKFSLGVAKFGAHLAGNVVSAPLKLLGGIGNLFTKKNSKKIRQANRDFRGGYIDETGRYQSGIIGKFLNPFAWGDRILKKTNVKGIGNKISGFFEAINPFEAYGEERMNFAKKRGLENDTAFTGGLFGAEWKRHKDAMKRINTQEELDKQLESIANQYAKKDKGNNKIQLNKNELSDRNSEIRKAYKAAGMKYTNMSNDQMMQFIYDPLGKRGENKEKLLKREEERHTEMVSIGQAIQNSVADIADVLTGRKRKMTDKQRKYLAKRADRKKRNEKDEREKAFRKLAEDPNAAGDDFDDLTFFQRMALRWNNYVDRVWDGTVGKAQSGFGKVKDAVTSIPGRVRNGVGNVKNNAKDNIADAWSSLAGFGNDAKKNANIAGNGLKRAGKFIINGFSNGLQRFSDWATMSTEERKNAKEAKAESKAKLNREYDVYKAVYKKNNRKLKKYLNDLENGKDLNSVISTDEAQSLGLDPSKDLNPQVRDKAGHMKKLSKREFKKAGSMEVALKATKGSLMEMLTKKKSAIVGLGTIAIGAAVTGLIVKFPQVIDWFKDKAVPFIKNTLWPFIKNTFTAIGNLLCGIGDFVRGGQKSTTKFLNFMSSGTWEDPDITEAKSQLNHENATLNDAEMKDFVQSNAAIYAITGKNANEEKTKLDYLAAALAYTGQLYRSDQGAAIDVTANDILTYLKSSNKENNRSGHSAAWITNSVYNKILNKLAPKELAKGHSRWQSFSESDLNTAANMAAKYLNEDKAASSQLIEQALNTGLAIDTDDTSVGAGHFTQTDPRWRNRRYANSRNGYSTIGNGGCGPTALANVAIQNGIRTNPVAVASMAQSSGYTAQGGSNARLFNEGANRLGLKSTAIGRGGIKRALSNGKSVIFAGRGHGFYTGAGHIMSARGLDRHGNAIVDDPLRKRSLSVPLSKIGNGLTNAWSIGRGDYDESAGSASTSSSSVATKNYGEYQLALHRNQTSVKDANNKYSGQITSSVETKNIGEYMNWMAEQNYDDYRSMYNLMRNDSLYIPIGNTWRPMYYSQVDEAWKNYQMLYESGTYGDAGCVVSALGSLLANITGLNYRPDVFDTMVHDTYPTAGVVGMLNAALPPSLQGRKAYRIRIYHPKEHDTDFSKFNFQDNIVYPDLVAHFNKDEYGLEDGTGQYYKTFYTQGKTANTAELIFDRNVLTNPFVLYGGTNWRDSNNGYPHSDKDAFITASGNGAYSGHAVLVIPDLGNKRNIKSDTEAPKFYVFNPGTGQHSVDSDGFRQATNTGMELTFDEMFSPKQGIQSMFVIDNAVSSPTQLKSYIGGSINSTDAKWFNSIENQKYSGKDFDDSSTQSSSADVTARAAEIAAGNNTSSSDDSSDKSFLSKLGDALGKLGTIASNLLGTIFGGEYKSIYNGASSGSSGSTSTSSTSSAPITYNYKEPSIDDMIDEYISMDSSSQDVMTSGSTADIQKLREDIRERLMGGDSDLKLSLSRLTPTGVTPYNSLPGYAKTSAGITTYGLSSALPKSSRLSAEDVANVEEGITRLVWAHEALGAYDSIIQNDNGGISAGIGGFHNGNLIEILYRMKNSGKLDENQQADIDDLLNNGFDKKGDAYYLRDDYYDTLVKLLQTDISHMCQDAFLHEMHMSSMINLIQAYDEGVFNDPRSLMAIGQFQGFGPAYVSGMLGKGSNFKVSGFPDAFKNYNYTRSEELANTITGMNDYYSRASKTYVTGHKNRFKSVYKELGGQQSLGFGGGIRDSYTTSGYYDSFDTPVAVNSVPKIEIEDAPITNRLDVIIEYLRKLLLLAGNSPATTAKDNLDIGRGLANDMKLNNAGLNLNETLPVYTKDEEHRDKMREIHNRIARSPRPV